jgi:hypothetical protein
MNTMTITSAKYATNKGEIVGINATIDNQEWCVPMTPGNRHYDEIMRQVEAGDLVIEQETQA